MIEIKAILDKDGADNLLIALKYAVSEGYDCDPINSMIEQLEDYKDWLWQ